MRPYEGVEYCVIMQVIPMESDYGSASVKFNRREEGVSVEYCLF